MNKGFNTAFYNPWLIFMLLLFFLFIEFSFEKIICSWAQGNAEWPYEYCELNILFISCTVFFFSTLLLGRCEHKYKLTSGTLKQLINNALGYKWLTLFILFFFMMHFSWTIDAGYAIFVAAEINQDTWMKIFNLIIPVVGMIVSALLIPNKQEKPRKLSEADIFLSPLSVSKGEGSAPLLKPHNLDLFMKPFFENGISYSKNNGKEELDGIREFLVIPSTSHPKCKIYEGKEEDWDSFLDNLNKSRICKHINKKILMEAIHNYNQSIEKDSNEKFNGLKSFLSELLPVDFIFPESPVDYDKFEEVFKVASQLLKTYETAGSYTLIHISPGTSIPAGALTALGIKKNRTIVYTAQNEKNKVSSINIDVNNMDEWLSELMSEKEVNG